MMSEAVKGGDRLANEHRTAFGVEGAIGGEQHSVRAREIEPAAYRRTRPADGRVIIEQPEIIDRPVAPRLHRGIVARMPL
jgi:hypothetical protein